MKKFRLVLYGLIIVILYLFITPFDNCSITGWFCYDTLKYSYTLLLIIPILELLFRKKIKIAVLLFLAMLSICGYIYYEKNIIDNSPKCPRAYNCKCNNSSDICDCMYCVDDECTKTKPVKCEKSVK